VGGSGCRQPADHSQLDHRKPYKQGGPTNRDNLNALCQHHHRGKDGGGLHLRKLPNGSYHWTTPLGRTYTWTPEPHWHPDWVGTGDGDPGAAGWPAESVSPELDLATESKEPDELDPPPF